MNLLAWYVRRMSDPTLSTSEYMRLWNAHRELEQQALRTYADGMRRLGELS